MRLLKTTVHSKACGWPLIAFSNATRFTKVAHTTPCRQNPKTPIDLTSHIGYKRFQTQITRHKAKQTQMADPKHLPTPPNNPMNKDQMHPEDLRNMFIFFILAAVLYFSYDSYVLKPQREAIKQRTQIEAEIKQALGPAALEEVNPVPTKPRSEIITHSGRIKIKNAEIYGSLDLNGGRLDDVALSEYFQTLEKKDNVTVLNPRLTEFPQY